ncbi:MAG TPA: NAD kinase [Streptosporangiaceae bacterium]|nr:NAD kinase [Streptosporangiaceae bacterium]
MSAPAERSILLVAHTGRPEGLQTARAVSDRLCAAGISMRVLESEADDLDCQNTTVLPVSPDAAKGAEMVLVIGGDGTLLRAAELARPAGTPLLGVNVGHVGFLAETEPDVLSDAVDHILAGHYWVEPRMTIDVTVQENGSVSAATWALNEATVEKAARERMVDLVIEVDGRPLARWGCDGMVFATPTGSTAYAFSAGGPVVWPDVEALLLVPISAHALFARPMVVSPESVLAAEVIGATGNKGGKSGAVLWCDGRRKIELPPGARIDVRRGAQPVLLARLQHDKDGDAAAVGPSTSGQGLDIGASFTDRLVAKFDLPVSGWRGRGRARRNMRQESATHERDEEPGGDA